jgi:DNA-directed RNA polymerase subunit H (RpoH/RPB5)
MPPEQAQQFLSSLGISPENLPMVIQAIDAVMAAQGGGGAGAPPPAGAPPA